MVVIDDTAYHFGASLKDLGKNTFFFTQEDFTLEEVLKESQKIQDTATIKFSNFTAGYLFIGNKNIDYKWYMHLYVCCSIIYKSQDMRINVQWNIIQPEKASTSVSLTTLKYLTM